MQTPKTTKCAFVKNQHNTPNEKSEHAKQKHTSNLGNLKLKIFVCDASEAKKKSIDQQTVLSEGGRTK
jgi:hypothetical protein